MKPREIFLSACQKLAEEFAAHGFKPLQKGSLLRRTAADKDMHEIYFATSHLNCDSHISLIPKFSISSKTLKKWEMEQFGNKDKTGSIYFNSLGGISPYRTYKEWNMAGASFEKCVQEITRDIKSYIFPIFEVFNDRGNAIAYLEKNGTQFNQWTEDSLFPTSFMICFAAKENAETFLKNFIRRGGKKPGKYYEELSKMDRKEIDLNYSSFMGETAWKLAFLHMKI
jgi:hypothetical protein